MKIRGWSIDGFGVFHDSAVADLPDGLTVLHGANEAGKSTLLEFLRRVLFGVPESSNGASYPPVRGGRHRGRLVVGDERGEVIVERELDQRRPPLLRRSDGSGLEPSMLSRLLGGADERLFRSVFAFSIDDLRSLAVLDAAGLRDALFSATLAGAGRSARATAAALHAQAAALLEGDSPAQIARLIAELNALRPRLNAARRGALAHAEERAAEQRLAAGIDAQRAALAGRRAARTRDDALLRAWPAWEALQAAHSELAALDPVPVSADAEARVRAARERLDAAERAAALARTEQIDAERQLGLVPALDPSGTLGTEVEALAADAPLHRLHVATLPAARIRAGEAERLLRERLHRAGDEWSADRLRQWSRASLDRDGIRDWQLRLRAAAEREQQAEWRGEAAGSATEAARRARDRAAAELPAAPAASGAAIDRQRQALGTLRLAMEEMTARRAHGEATAQALHERERALRELEAQQDPAPSPLLRGGLEVAAVASGGAGVWMLAQGALPFGAGLGVIAAVAAAVSRWAAAQQQAHARREEERHLERRALRSEMETSRRSRDSEWHRAAELADEVARVAASLGLSRAPSLAEVEMRERALDAEALAEAQLGVVRARVVELERGLADREAEERVRVEELARARAARQALEAEWTGWRAATGFAADATPDDVLERAAALEAAQVALAAYDAAARELQQLEPQVAAWQERARLVLARGAATVPGLGDEALVDHLMALRLRLQEEGPQRARRAALERELSERGAGVAAADAELERCRAGLEAALLASGVRDEAELIRRRAVAQHRAALETTIAEHERLAAERLGDAQAMAELATGAVDAWRQRATAADAEIGVLEQELYRLVAEQQQVRASCRALEASAEVPTLEGEWAALMAELAEAVRDWRVLAAAEGLIEEARASFERTRQPGVLCAASQAFAQVTSGRYPQIVQDDGGQTLQVVDRDGRRKEVGHELSRGTAEQLYISLRLGLAQELAERGIALPLVMDDVLVHFDPVRARAMAEVLGTFARSQQVLFFTCHAATRDLLLEHGRAERLVEL